MRKVTIHYFRKGPLRDIWRAKASRGRSIRVVHSGPYLIVNMADLKLCDRSIFTYCDWKDGRHSRHLENHFFCFSPEPKGKLTWNLVGSIGVIGRSKIAKIVPIGNPRRTKKKKAKIVAIGNPRWLPWRPSWKYFFRFFSWTERPIDLKLGRKHSGDL